MRLFLLTSLTMIAFAANSVLNRLALKGALIDALDFAAIRLGSGALALVLLAIWSGRRLPIRSPKRVLGAGALLAYVLGFSYAYLSLDAGAGALILFGGVQITMFAGALVQGESILPQRWLGAMLALVGLVWLLRPEAGTSTDLWPIAAMSIAAIGWGAYSLAGRGGGDALGATAANFLVAAPFALLLAPIAGGTIPATVTGVVLALISGILTSGMSYALWYHVLPSLGATRAGVAQLTVPVIAVAGGVIFLGEPLTSSLLVAGALVLGGVSLAILPQREGARRA